VKDKIVIIYDDMIRTGGSLIQAAEAYANAGAKTVYAITTHGLFTNHAIDKIASHGLIQKVICTNTHPNALEQNHPLLEVKSVSNVIFDALN
jgi:ribose-phosphate pyrophosphokinase